MLSLSLLVLLYCTNPISTSVEDTFAKQKHTDAHYKTRSIDTLSVNSFVSEDSVTLSGFRPQKNNNVLSSGFYHVTKIDDRWWLVDPDGNIGINMAVNSVRAYDSSDNGDSESLRAQDYGLLHNLGFNGSGNFLNNEDRTSWANIENMQNPSVTDTERFDMSYTRRCNFFERFCKKIYSGEIVLQEGWDGEPILYDSLAYFNTIYEWQDDTILIKRFRRATLNLVLAKEYYRDLFVTHCEDWARENIPLYANERNLLGYFTDNELAFKDSVHLAQFYYRTVCNAIRRYDQNHMIIGSRLHGSSRKNIEVVRAAQTYCDITSVNFYDKFCPNDEIASWSWTNDHPCLVTEFYTKQESFNPNYEQEGAGWYVKDQSDRGKWYQNTCIQLLRNKCFVGWHHFRFMDSRDGFFLDTIPLYNKSNKGIIALRDSDQLQTIIYSDMTDRMSVLNHHVYQIIDYLDGKAVTSISPVLSLSSLTIDTDSGRENLPGFSPNKLEYNYELAANATSVPSIHGTRANHLASISVTNGTLKNGLAKSKIVLSYNDTVVTYNVNFHLANEGKNIYIVETKKLNNAPFRTIPTQGSKYAQGAVTVDGQEYLCDSMFLVAAQDTITSFDVPEGYTATFTCSTTSDKANAKRTVYICNSNGDVVDSFKTGSKTVAENKVVTVPSGKYTLRSNYVTCWGILALEYNDLRSVEANVQQRIASGQAQTEAILPNRPVKKIRDGKLVILINEKEFDSLGRRIK